MSSETRFVQQSQDKEEVVFISSNWRDFYDLGPGKQSTPAKDGKPSGRHEAGAAPANATSPTRGNKVKLQFHPDLTHDLKELKRPVLPFESVVAFVDTRVDKNEHAINYDKRFELFEAFLEERGLDILSRLDERHGPVVLQQIFSPSTARALTILSSDAEALEGVEDLDIYSTEEVGQDIYVNCGYDLRIANVTLFIPRTQFDVHRSEVEAAPHVWEITPLDHTVAIRLSLRAYYQASFSFAPQTEGCEGFSLQTFSVR